MIILKKNIKFLITLFILLGLSLHSNFVYAAGSSDDASKNKVSLYKAGKKLVLRAKKLEKKDKVEKAKKLYLKAYNKFEKAYAKNKKNAMITDPEIAKKHVIKMVESQALNCYSGKQIPCEIDSICVHGDGKSAVGTAKQIREGLIKSGVTLNPLDKMKKFV